MNLFKFTKMAFIRTFDFTGRSSRQEFWWFQLGIIILAILISLLSMLVYLLAWWAFGNEVFVENLLNGISSIFGIFTLITHVSIFVRRLHDINRSGWWLLMLIPTIFISSIGIIMYGQLGLILGYIIMLGILFITLYWLCKKSDDGKNKYGFLEKLESPWL